MTKEKKSFISRRRFLALTGGTGAALLFNSQEKYVHKLIPYVNAPQYPQPGEWAHYLTSCRECPAGCGLMMWYRDGRVTKAEGNPENPVNKGKLCIRGQSSVLGEYDLERVKNPLVKTEEGKFTNSSWDDVLPKIKAEMFSADKVMLISDLQTGSLAGVMEEFTAGYNQKPLYYEAFNYESMRRANTELYGQPLIPKYNIEESDLILSFGADFLETWLSPVEYTRQFTKAHALKNNSMGKFIYFGPVQNMTATNSDEFVVTEPGMEAGIIEGLMQRLGQIDAAIPGNPATLSVELNAKLDRIAEEIRKAQKPVVLAGNGADKSFSGQMTVKAANRLNEMLGNTTMDFSSAHAISKTAMSNEIRNFFNSITENTVLIVHNTNPVYTEPELQKYFGKTRKIIFIGSKQNETSAFADWILPSNYYLEDWGDFETWSGTVSLMQPVMRPLYDTKSAGDIFLALGRNETPKPYSEIVRENWKKWDRHNLQVIQSDENNAQEGNFSDEDFYNGLLQKGFLEKTTVNISLFPLLSENQLSFQNKKTNENSFYLIVSPSHFFYDGSLANRGWLQEIPHPVSNVAWQSWVDMNSVKAKELEINEGDILKIKTASTSLEVAVRLTEDIDKNTLAIDTGQGHTHLGEIANGIGVNAFALIPFSLNGMLPEVTIEKTGKNEPLLYLNATKDQHERELLQHVELEKLQNGTAKTEEMNWPMKQGYSRETDLYDGQVYKEHRWGMVIDLHSCIGCKACEAACYAENNIPVVGKENSREGREMSWLKVPPYKLSEKQTAYLPTPCQQCDSAPCEPVCPVYASVHNEEGLNAQIYNRCIGTRYCSNNCPYKVRRFNWGNVKHEFPMTLQLNPEVTVRERGVMEKCTFCVQRIRNKEYQAKTGNRKLEDGEIVPACAQTCPSEAIVFGDLLDENSKVRKLIESKRKYQLLNELNTKTAVVYLKKITI